MVRKLMDLNHKGHMDGKSSRFSLQYTQKEDLMTLFTKVSLPKNTDHQTLFPVLYLLHGMGSDEEDIFSLFESLKDRFILIAFRGPHQRANGYTYYNLLRIGYPDITSFESILTQLKLETQIALSRYPIDPEFQFFAGFSQGAILSMSMVIRYGSAFKGVAALHGYIPQHVLTENIADLEAVHVLLTQGNTDELFSPAIGKANEAFFNDRSPLVTFLRYPHGHWVSEDEKADVLAWLAQFASSSHPENTMMGIMKV